MVLLDTHIWVWWLGGTDDLTNRERDELDYLASRHQLALSAISLWEVQIRVAKGAIQITMSFDQWIREAARPDLVTVIPIDTNVAIALQDIPVTFQGDPADRLIVASAISRKYELATHDKVLRRTRLVRIWKP